MKVITYQEMNAKIVEFLRTSGDNVSLYAAERIEGLENTLREVKSIVDSIPKGGSKEGRPDYGTMVTSDKIYRLRQLTLEDGEPNE